MAFTDSLILTTDPDFVGKVKLAAVKAAIAVMAELPETDDHERRASFAVKVMGQPDRYAAMLVVGVAANPAIVIGAPDGDIEFTVNSLFDAYSQVPG